MAIPTTLREGDGIGVSSPTVALVPSRRLPLVRMVAAAHLFAGALIALSIAGNLALDLNYTGGPMGYFGSGSVGLAGCLNNMAHLRVWNAERFWAQYDNYAASVYMHAQTSPRFFISMAAAHIGLAVLCAGIGYGLWRREALARMADLVVIGVSAVSATAHGVILLTSGFGNASLGLEALVITAVVAGPILVLLLSPGTAALFDPSASAETGLAHERRWWSLSVQWLLAALVGVFALGLVRLLYLGPIVEVIWAVALWSRDGIGF